MYNLYVTGYLRYCQTQKNLDTKTIKAYQIDLEQFGIYLKKVDLSMDIFAISRNILSEYIAGLHDIYKPKSIKRKIASLKAFFNYLEYEEFISENPFTKIKVRYKEPELLPRTISIISLQKLLSYVYNRKNCMNNSSYQRKMMCRDIAVLELMFSTGLRVSELCNLKKQDLDLAQGIVKICGKGSKERMIYFANQAVIHALKEYQELFQQWIDGGVWFFYNRCGHRLSEQSVRFMLRRYSRSAGIQENVTSHMLRHTFATLLLEENVDIRYIQQILGHSSITTTQIYTHVAMQKQKLILTERHPRNKIEIL